MGLPISGISGVVTIKWFVLGVLVFGRGTPIFSCARLGLWGPPPAPGDN